jgi:hypothetical protein
MMNDFHSLPCPPTRIQSRHEFFIDQPPLQQAGLSVRPPGNRIPSRSGRGTSRLCVQCKYFKPFPLFEGLSQLKDSNCQIITLCKLHTIPTTPLVAPPIGCPSAQTHRGAAPGRGMEVDRPAQPPPTDERLPLSLAHML